MSVEGLVLEAPEAVLPTDLVIGIGDLTLGVQSDINDALNAVEEPTRCSVYNDELCPNPNVCGRAGCTRVQKRT
ncbi:MAG TPA: hypothetical protein VMR45_03605 [Patescibacteria group bacterium]|nr:hypothetical protein [Patescibacteria group bacterium]